jgi:protocatechuate 3,4-dioxygenase beta subunit
MRQPPPSAPRRRLLGGIAASPLLALPAALTAAPATPECSAPAAVTAAQAAGPFVRDELPWRRNLRAEDERTPILQLRGTLRDRDCQPLREAVISLWHAGPDGRYDLHGGRYYGRQRSEDGQYAFLTTLPGVYPARVRHLHVQISTAEGRLLLTTQLYFPDEPDNARDGLFQPALLMQTAPTATGWLAAYDFVV